MLLLRVSDFIHDYADCHYAENRFAECHYAECCYSECRGAASELAVGPILNARNFCHDGLKCLSLPFTSTLV